MHNAWKDARYSKGSRRGVSCCKKRHLDEEGGLPAKCWPYDAAEDVAARNADGWELQQQHTGLNTITVSQA